MFPQSDNSAVYKAQSARWVLTVYDLDEQGSDFIRWLRAEHDSDRIKDYFFGGEECPTTGTNHLHVGIRFPSNVRYNALKRMLQDAGLRAWMAPMKGTWKQAHDYAWKDKTEENTSSPDWPCDRWDSTCQTMIEEESSTPVRKRKLQLTQEQTHLLLTGNLLELYRSVDPIVLVESRKMMKETMELVPSRQIAPLVVWIYGETQCGKTTFAEWIASNSKASVHWQGLEENARFWNGYVGQEIVVLDEARERNLPFQTFLRLCMRQPLNVEVKSSHRALDSPVIIVTAPTPPWNFWAGTVDQRGHLMDIEQVLSRISIVVHMQSRVDPNPQEYILTPIRPWSVTMNLSEDNSSLLYRQLFDDIRSHGTQQCLSMVHLATNVTVPYVKHPDAQEYAFPVLTREIEIMPSSAVTAQGTETESHWTNNIRLPQGISDELRKQLVHHLKKPRKYKLRFVVMSRRLSDPCVQCLFQHYFDDFFEFN